MRPFALRRIVCAADITNVASSRIGKRVNKRRPVSPHEFRKIERSVSHVTLTSTLQAPSKTPTPMACLYAWKAASGPSRSAVSLSPFREQSLTSQQPDTASTARGSELYCCTSGTIFGVPHSFVGSSRSVLRGFGSVANLWTASMLVYTLPPSLVTSSFLPGRRAQPRTVRRWTLNIRATSARDMVRSPAMSIMAKTRLTFFHLPSPRCLTFHLSDILRQKSISSTSVVTLQTKLSNEVWRKVFPCNGIWLLKKLFFRLRMPACQNKPTHNRHRQHSSSYLEC